MSLPIKPARVALAACLPVHRAVTPWKRSLLRDARADKPPVPPVCCLVALSFQMAEKRPGLFFRPVRLRNPDMHRPSEKIDQVSNALSFDIEDWFHMVEIDAVSDPKTWPDLDSIVERYTEWIVQTVTEADVKATFFVLAGSPSGTRGS